MNCIFCRIVEGTVPAKQVLDTTDVLAFHDLNPAAPVHVLVIPKLHVSSLATTMPEHDVLLGRVLLAGKTVAEKLGVDETGFRTVLNVGPHAGQSVDHLHLHVIGGRPLAWPPG